MDDHQIMREAANQQHMMQQRHVHGEMPQEEYQEQSVQPETISDVNLVSSVQIPTQQQQQIIQPPTTVPLVENKSSMTKNIINILFEPVLLALLLVIFFHPTIVSTLKLDNYLGNLGDERTFNMNLGKRILTIIIVYLLIRKLYTYFFQ